MAVKQYIAIADGYVDGRVIKAGQAFSADFRELVRDEDARPTVPGKKDIAGNVTRPAVFPIKRDDNGNPVTKDAEPPSWARYADKKEYIAAQASDNQVTDPNFDAMGVEALQAYAAERNVPFEKSTKKADLITAIKAAKDFTR